MLGAVMTRADTLRILLAAEVPHDVASIEAALVAITNASTRSMQAATNRTPPTPTSTPYSPHATYSTDSPDPRRAGSKVQPDPA